MTATIYVVYRWIKLKAQCNMEKHIDKSTHSLTRIKIGTNVIACDFSAKRLFDRNHPLRRNAPAMEPHGDMGLTDSLASNLCQPLGQSGLTTTFGNCVSDSVHVHGANYNTDSVMRVNTRSVFEGRQTSGMPKAGRETEFWKRLVKARTTCIPPKSMKQIDLAKEYGAAFQSTVTKWKTGGETGHTKPQPEVVEKMAKDTGVNFNWLFSGQGEMRERPTPDAVTQEIMEAVAALSVEGKIEVLKEAIAQQTVQLPAVKSRIQEAQRAATAKTKSQLKRPREIRE